MNSIYSDQFLIRFYRVKKKKESLNGTTAKFTSNSNANSPDSECCVYIQPESKMKCKAALGREVFETFYFPPLRLFFLSFLFRCLLKRNGLKMNQIFLSFPSCTNVFFSFVVTVYENLMMMEKKFVWILSLHSTNSTVLLFSIHNTFQWYLCGEQFKKLLMYINLFFISFP